MKVLVIGSGGREHALVWKLAQSRRISQLFCLPGNAGTASLATNVNIPIHKYRQILEFAKDKRIDLTLVGPEAPLIAGLADLFRQNKLTVIGPSAKAARLEGSKVFAKKLMKKYAIPTAKFSVFKSLSKARAYARKQLYPLVIKADGQCLGKGVAVCRTYAKANEFLTKLMKNKLFGRAAARVIIEECLIGQEVSFMAVTDGTDFVTLLPSQDHKRARDGDRGSNTGGIGAYAPVPFLTDEMIKLIEKSIIAPTIAAMGKEGNPYQGILYPGLILTENGPYVLEYNCRFGDPETQPLMQLLKTDLMDILTAIQRKAVGKLKITWKRGSAVCVILTAKGYPGKYVSGMEINIPENMNKLINIFLAGVKKQADKITAGSGRVLAVCARGETLEEAIKLVYSQIGKDVIHFKNMRYRKDIAQKGLEASLWKNLK